VGLLEDVATETRQAADVLREWRRSQVAGASTGFGTDDRFWRSYAYSFRLVEGNVIQNFPLVLNPERYEKSYPFALDITPTQEGGIFVERQGVVVFSIDIEGTTGFAPRPNPGDNSAPLLTVPVSGQAHFKRLQDLCFLEHSRRVKDPERAKHVMMTFHNFKDDEHFIVEPEVFSLKRTKDERVLYRYIIRLKVFGEVKDVPRAPSEDQPAIDAISGASAQLTESEAAINAANTDLEGVLGEIEAISAVVGGGFNTVRDLLGQLNTQTSRLLGAVGEYIRGIKRTIAIPFALVTDIRNRLDQITDLLRRSGNIPLDVIQIYQTMEDAVDVIGTYPELFVEPFDVAAEEFLKLTQGPATAETSDLESAVSEAVTQMTSFRSSALRPGDLARVNGGIYQQRRNFPRYEGFREVVLLFHDTLQKLAARELNDARRWVDIAIANDLQAPYISAEGLPGTKQPGDTILIPTEKRRGELGKIRSAGDPELRASQQEVVLGRDLALKFDRRGKADLVVDTAGGATDFKTVAGLPNLEQALIFRLSIERGQDVLYQQLGYERIIGQRGTFERLIGAQLSIAEAVSQDPRIQRVSNLAYNTNDQADVLDVTMDALLIDGTQERVKGRVLS
jgi:hypothetical protein